MARGSPDPVGREVTGRLSALDASFVALERRGVRMNVGGFVVLDPPPPGTPPITVEALRRRVLQRLAVLPRLRDRVVDVPLGIARPVWAPDPDFDVGRHVHAVRLAGPGGLRQAERLAERLQDDAMDLTRPPWDLHLVEGADGLDPPGSAVYLRLHHCFVDGLRGLALGARLFDLPDGAPPEPDAPDAPPRTAPARRLEDVVAEAVAENAQRAVQRAFEVTIDAIDPLASLRREHRLLGDALGVLTGPVPRSSLNGRAGRQRRIAWGELSRPRLLVARRAHRIDAATAVLTVVAGALARLFLARGERCPLVRVVVPMSGSRSADAVLGNDNAAVLVDLPTGPGPAVERLAGVSAALARAREAQLDLVRELARRADSHSWATTQAFALLAGDDDTSGALVSYLRWPRPPASLLGHPYRITYPALPLGSRLGLLVGIAEVGGRISVGVATDAGVVPEAAFLVAALGDSLAELAG